MLGIAIYAIINGSSVVFGAVIGTFKKLKPKTTAAFMAFGSGVLICALTFGLMEEAFKHGGFDAVVIGFLLGGVLFLSGDYFIHKLGGRKNKSHYSVDEKKDETGLIIALGSVLDGIPESIALGIALFANQGIGLMLLVAIFFSNFPEGISSACGLREDGFSRSRILLIWISVGLAIALATILSFIFLNDLNPNNIGILEALAAGAILAMLTDGMMPEAYEKGGYAIGILTIFGFLASFVMSRL